ncbi:hypothetical protein Ahy_B09g095300 [Arachis hypogaea]|uniref:PB1 domain-containing protein n=1 Tax=Arachis hypogaea TaxID=3818 RepID=A0A444XDF7_ARAHY|nr:hypothetical protein Ahy_B09g095300 [Arachis hypogaea]
MKTEIPGYGLETLLSITNDRDLRNLMRNFDPNTPHDVKHIFLFFDKNPSPFPPPQQIAENTSELAAGAGPRVVHCLMLVSAGLLLTAVLLFLVSFVFTLQQQNHSVMVVNDNLKSTGTIAVNDDQSVSDKIAKVLSKEMKTEMSFLCSYGGQIKFYDRNNQYLYERGNNKKLHVRSSINFNDMIAELSAISGTADMAYFKYQIPGYGLETLLSITNDKDLCNLMRDFDPNTPDDVKHIFLFSEENPSPSPPPQQVAENASEMAAGAGQRVVHCLMLASAGLLFTAVLLLLVPFVFTLQQQNHSVMVVNDDLKSIGTIAVNDDQSVSDKATKVPGEYEGHQKKVVPL